MNVAQSVTFDQFREAIFAGWKNCTPGDHIDISEAWQHLLAGGLTVDDGAFDWERKHQREPA